MKLPVRIGLYSLHLLLVAGCASTAPAKPPAPEKRPDPHPGRFAAPTASTTAEQNWIGSYVGTVDFYIGAEERWQKDSPISLFIQPEEGSGLRLLGHVMLTAGRRSFYIGKIGEPPGNTIAGEYTDDGILVTTRYIYALNLNGALATGTVKTQVRSHSEEGFQPADEWRFDVERRTTFPPR